MDKKDAVDKINEIYEVFQRGNIIRIPANRIIAYGIAVIFIVLNARLRPLLWFFSEASLNVYLATVGNRVLFAAFSIVMCLLLFITAGKIADIFTRKSAPQTGKIVKMAFSLYKPIVVTIISLIVLANIGILDSGVHTDINSIIEPMILILVGYIIFFIGKFSDRKIFIIALIDIIGGLSILLVFPLLKALFYEQLFYNNPFPGIIYSLIHLVIATSLISTGIIYKTTQQNG